VEVAIRYLVREVFVGQEHTHGGRASPDGNGLEIERNTIFRNFMRGLDVIAVSILHILIMSRSSDESHTTISNSTPKHQFIIRVLHFYIHVDQGAVLF